MAPSFDITPKKTVPKKSEVQKRSVPATPAAKPAYVRPVVREQTPSVRPQKRRGIVPLRERRRVRRKRMASFIGFGLLCLVVLVGVVLWQAPLRVTNISASGAHESELPDFVRTKLVGTVYGVLPRNSIFFIPRDELRMAILDAYPDIEAVSIAPSGLTTLSVSAIGRASSFWWCGSDRSLLAACYDADTSGKIFKEASIPTTASTTASSTSISFPVGAPFVVYGAYQGGTETSPVGGMLGNASKLPNMFRLVKSLKALGANIVSVQLRGDEADLYTATGTRITYVLGREQEALTLAATAFPDLDVSGTTLLYIDLRFTSKVYFKKRGTP